MPIENIVNCNHVPNVRKISFINGNHQQVSECEKCGCLLYKELWYVSVHGSKWYKPIYNKIRRR